MPIFKFVLIATAKLRIVVEHSKFLGHFAWFCDEGKHGDGIVGKLGAAVMTMLHGVRMAIDMVRLCLLPLAETVVFLY